MLYESSIRSFFFIFFIKSLFSIKSSDTLTGVYSLLSSNKIIELSINQDGYHKIYHLNKEYILNVKINNITIPNYSEAGIYLFPYEHNIVELSLNPVVKNLSNLFYSCKNITKIDFTRFSFDNIISLEGLFNGCSSLTSIEFGNIKSKKVQNMSWMFNDCISLETLNLSKFITKNVTDMKWMFHNCSSLISLNLSSFNTNAVKNMEAMFDGNIKLTSLILINFNTSQVLNMSKMFEKCESLEKLNLSSFETYNVTDMSYMFNGCSKLNYINFTNLNLEKILYIDFMLNSTSKNVTFCIGEAKNFYNLILNKNFKENLLECVEEIDSYLTGEKTKIIDCYNFYYEENNNKYLCKSDKIILDNSFIIFQNEISCQGIIDYPNENTINQGSCPEHFIKGTKEEFSYCVPKCPENLPFLLIYQAECVFNCTISERQNRKCITYYRENNFNAFDIIINQTKEELAYNFNKSVINGHKINEFNFNISILSIDLNEINSDIEEKTLLRRLHENNINEFKKDLNKIEIIIL